MASRITAAATSASRLVRGDVPVVLDNAQNVGPTRQQQADALAYQDGRAARAAGGHGHRAGGAEQDQRGRVRFCEKTGP